MSIKEHAEALILDVEFGELTYARLLEIRDEIKKTTKSHDSGIWYAIEQARERRAQRDNQ